MVTRKKTAKTILSDAVKAAKAEELEEMDRIALEAADAASAEIEQAALEAEAELEAKTEAEPEPKPKKIPAKKVALEKAPTKEPKKAAKPKKAPAKPEGSTAPEAPAEPKKDEDKPAEAPVPRKKRTKEELEAASNPSPDQTAKMLSQARKKENVQRSIREEARAISLEERQEFLAGINIMQEAMSRKTIKTGVVVALERKDLRNTAVATVRLSIIVFVLPVDDRFKVMVPFDEFFRDNPIDMKTVDLKSRKDLEYYQLRQRQMAEKMYGATVDFLVTGVKVNQNSGDYAIVGSRKQALAMREFRNFVGNEKMPPKLKVGDVVKAKVLAVGQYNLYVSVGGVDCSVPVRELTFRYSVNLATGTRSMTSSKCRSPPSKSTPTPIMSRSL